MQTNNQNTEKAKKDLLIFETHPVQYRVPVYQCLERLQPGSFEVVYASDCSVRGVCDRGFGETIAWDIPLLQGYSFRVMRNERGVPLCGWGSLTGKGVFRLLHDERPRAVLMTSFDYCFNITVFFSALLLRIPIWIRMETQDYAFDRGWLKGCVRNWIFRLFYLAVSKAFFVGDLNREHLLKHGMNSECLMPARYCVLDPAEGMTTQEKALKRKLKRDSLGISSEKCVIAFFGKFIPKKDPELLLASVSHLPFSIRERVMFLYVGAGELREALSVRAEAVRRETGIETLFTGFVNQSDLIDYYFASDILVLPSRRMGETWGLVANEALNAGCGVVLSDQVGCHVEFKSWERVRVIPSGDEKALARAIEELSLFPRDFDWAKKGMEAYSVEAVAKSIGLEIASLGVPSDKV